MKPEPNPIAVVAGEGESVQSLFAAMARKWQSDGLRVAGLVAEPHALPDRSCTAGILRNVASGEPFAMYLETAPAGTSCHLDADHVEAACTSILDQLRDADIVVLSKFGKLEAQGKGLWPAFRASLEAGKPVLTSVSAKHRDAWQAFAPEADLVDADEAALSAWRAHAG
jgi:nucleoside-triphosphatase THEP1